MQTSAKIINHIMFRGQLKAEAIAARRVIEICTHGCNDMPAPRRDAILEKIAPYADVARAWLAKQAALSARAAS